MQISRGIIRYVLRQVIPHSQRFKAVLKVAKWFKPVLPVALKQKMPDVQQEQPWVNTSHQRRMLVVEGCAQSVLTPATNAAAARVFDKLGVQLVIAPKAGCCGALSHHLSAQEESLAMMRRNIDAWWPYIEQGIEAILSTASGCGVVIKDYAHLLKDDAAYAAKAKRVSALAKDISEVLANENWSSISFAPKYKKVAFHSPCTLQHGQKLSGVVEGVLSDVGYKLSPVQDAHLCCGSAGTYSLLQPELSQQLLINKLSSLQENKPDVIASANVGCQMHLASQASAPVKHWIELVDEACRRA